MHSDTIRALRDKRPFAPFDIALKDGRVLRVRNRNSLSAARVFRGRVYIADRPGAADRTDLESIASVNPAKRRRRTTRRPPD